MQYDMHYYGTYAMAAAAGIPKKDAEIIATSAQFVDDHNVHDWVVAKSLEGILGVATAHHPLEAGVRAIEGNSSIDDSRLVWVPYHFLPGNQGNTFEERMIARKDSKVVNTMLDFYLAPETLAAHKDHALQLMGIAAHVYADTFSHYGFSGMRSDLNCVNAESIQIDQSHHVGIIAYITQKKDEFMAKWGGLPELGHGAVLTHPDRPYLKWSFQYTDGRSSPPRDNPATFVEGCQALHRRFAQFASLYYGASHKVAAEWAQLAEPVRRIIEKEGKAEERVKFWQDAIKEGQLGTIDLCADYDPTVWEGEVERVKQSADATEFLRSDAYRFFVAADYHRGYVLKRLLPQFGLMVA